MNIAIIEMTNCTECRDHKVVPDPDMDDWFCDDDVAVVCSKEGKYITRACRPYDISKECAIPDWCPRRKDVEGSNGTENSA